MELLVHIGFQHQAAPIIIQAGAGAQRVFQSIQQGILICDRMGRIVYFNEAYGRMIGRSLADVRGTPVKKLRPHSRVPDVLHSEQPLEGFFRREGSQEYFVNIYPLFDRGEESGTISIVTTLDISRQQEESHGLTLKEKVQQFERKEIEKALDLYGHDLTGKKKAAKQLGISLSSLYSKLSGGA